MNPIRLLVFLQNCLQIPPTSSEGPYLGRVVLPVFGAHEGLLEQTDPFHRSNSRGTSVFLIRLLLFFPKNRDYLAEVPPPFPHYH